MIGAVHIAGEGAFAAIDYITVVES